jgi:hypothetical protein
MEWAFDLAYVNLNAVFVSDLVGGGTRKCDSGYGWDPGCKDDRGDAKPLTGAA